MEQLLKLSYSIWDCYEPLGTITIAAENDRLTYRKVFYTIITCNWNILKGHIKSISMLKKNDNRNESKRSIVFLISSCDEVDKRDGIRYLVSTSIFPHHKQYDYVWCMLLMFDNSVRRETSTTIVCTKWIKNIIVSLVFMYW